MATLGSDADQFLCGIANAVGGLAMAGYGAAHPSLLFLVVGSTLAALGLVGIREAWRLGRIDASSARAQTVTAQPTGSRIGQPVRLPQ